MATVEISKSLLKKAHSAANDSVKSQIEAQVPDLFDGDGWLLDVTDEGLQQTIRAISEDISDPPPHVGPQSTRLIEPLLKTGYGDENGHGLYLHRRGGDVAWYAKPTKKGKAVCLVPVEVGSAAEDELIDLGYTKL